MINLSKSTEADIPQIIEWSSADPYHFYQGQPEWWLTDAPGSLLAFCLMDQYGPISYVRLDAEGDIIRIHTQFAPRIAVSRRRLVVGMLAALDALQKFFQSDFKGFVFNSIDQSLIVFLDKRLDFKSIGNDDYRKDFEVTK